MNIKNIDKSKLRKFGLIWSGIFLIITLYIFYYSNKIIYQSITLSLLFLLISLFFPIFLKYFYIIWIKIGEFLGFYISLIIMFFIYFLLFTPISMLLSLFGKDLLNKKICLNKKSYWSIRTNQPNSMKKQF